MNAAEIFGEVDVDLAYCLANAQEFSWDWVADFLLKDTREHYSASAPYREAYWQAIDADGRRGGETPRTLDYLLGRHYQIATPHTQALNQAKARIFYENYSKTTL